MTELLDPAEMQVVSLALAELSLHRPGWLPYIREVTEKLGVTAGFEAFVAVRADEVQVDPAPVAFHVYCRHGIGPGNFAKGRKTEISEETADDPS